MANETDFNMTLLLLFSLKESPKYDSKVAGILQKLQENVKMQKSQALQEERFQPRSDVEDARLMDSRHVAGGEPQGNAGSGLPFLGGEFIRCFSDGFRVMQVFLRREKHVK